MRLREAASLALILSGMMLLAWGLLAQGTPRDEARFLVEGGTYEILPCNVSYLLIEDNGSICIDLRDISLRPLLRGSSLTAENVSFPLIRGEGGGLRVSVRNLDAEWNIAVDLVDGGYLIPVERGEWNLSVHSDSTAALFEIVDDRPRDGRVIKEGDVVRIPCDDHLILLFNPSETPVEVRVRAIVEEDRVPTIAAGIAMALAGAALRRRDHADRSGRKGSDESSVAALG